MVQHSVTMNFLYNLNFLNHKMKTRSKNKKRKVSFGKETVFDGVHLRDGSKPHRVTAMNPKMDRELKNMLWFPSDHATRTATRIRQEQRRAQRASDMTRLRAAVRKRNQTKT